MIPLAGILVVLSLTSVVHLLRPQRAVDVKAVRPHDEDGRWTRPPRPAPPPFRVGAAAPAAAPEDAGAAAPPSITPPASRAPAAQRSVPLRPSIDGQLARQSTRAIGREIFQTLYEEKRSHYLSEVGPLKQCAIERIARGGWKSWYMSGSVILDVEVEDGWMYIRGARPVPDDPPAPQPADDEYWTCYDRAVRRMSFSCRRCRPGKQTLQWSLHSSLIAPDGHPRFWDKRSPDPATDPKFRLADTAE